MNPLIALMTRGFTMGRIRRTVSASGTDGAIETEFGRPKATECSGTLHDPQPLRGRRKRSIRHRRRWLRLR
jgi:hypothetical protein